ncbi:cytochrome c oxidase assembly protein [Actinoalloteichus caeruleus]|uniref:Copper resistance protein D n=1 Tax=Actinoalloteichus caeruleus DSM 43889 TaxID=1120930 RepID=A0ABT1JPM7_ACTCY|nr:cytochrome c oxidase assembly protein [Actinoalloteichus caeruleus]MCP2334124.1 putative copper resistance protein D [Actinoalloteichus caeruleus DSM 43889]
MSPTLTTERVEADRKEPARRSAVGVLAVVLPGTVLAALVAALVLMLSATDTYLALGLPDPGDVVRYGLPVARVVAEVGAAVTIGSLLLAAFLTPPQRSGELAADGFAAVRIASWAAAAWALGAAVTVPLSLADAVGWPLARVLDWEMFGELLGQLEQARAWAWTAGLALAVAVACRVVLTWSWAVAWFFLSLAALLPVAMTGHSASGGAHDVATNSLLFHLFGTMLWVGGLIALVTHALRGGRHLGLAARRFSRLALVCWIAMGVSGVVNALSRLRPDELLTSTYGQLVVAKAVAILLLLVFGYLQRERSVAEIERTGSARPLIRLGAVEILLMLVTVGLAVGLGRTPPPREVANTEISAMELVLGFELDGPFTFGRMVLDWRFDLVYGTLSLVLAGLYLAGVRRLRRRGDAWPVGRTVAWLGGCATVLIATSSGLGKYSPAMFSAHMGAHMMLAMLAPILLALGGAVTLALRALPTAGKDGAPGPREWLLAAVQSPVTRVLAHPLVALVLFVGSFYGLYFSGLFDVALDQHWAHLAMNAHFLVTGYLFYWLVIGVDPAPHRLAPMGRLGLMFASMPFHAFFGIILMGSSTIIGESFYRGLSLPWVSDLLEDQRLGGGLSWASGEVPVLVVIVALLVQWARSDARDAARSDRRAESDGDADLAAYNRMLRDLNGPGK